MVAVMIMVAVTIVIPVPIAVIVPLAVTSIPPGVVGIPAALAFTVQFLALLVGLAAAFAVLANRVFELGFAFFNLLPALVPIIFGIDGGSGSEQRKEGAERCAGD